MVLSGHEIRKQLGQDIVIDPFDESRLNPNSYNLTLHDESADLRRGRAGHAAAQPRPPHGDSAGGPRPAAASASTWAARVERTETRNYVPMIEGRSSIGRLGLFVHVTAGFGDVGFCGFWTLEMFAVQPVRIYAGVAICQIFYHDIRGTYHRICQRQVPEQPRHPAQPAVQGAFARLQRPAADAFLPDSTG